MRTIDIMYPLLFTTATGALVTILWFVAGKLLERMGCLHIKQWMKSLIVLQLNLFVILLTIRKTKKMIYCLNNVSL